MCNANKNDSVLDQELTWGKKYNAGVYFAFRVTLPCFVLCVQIAAATIGNANILLQIDNSKLAADDFKNK